MLLKPRITYSLACPKGRFLKFPSAKEYSAEEFLFGTTSSLGGGIRSSKWSPGVDAVPAPPYRTGLEATACWTRLEEFVFEICESSGSEPCPSMPAAADSAIGGVAKPERPAGGS